MAVAARLQDSLTRFNRSYIDRTPRSRELFNRAKEILPNGVTHVGRYLEPYPIYVNHGDGSRKWDVDGNEYVDYFGGHGALLLGHCHPRVTAAVCSQAARGAHFGSSHELELEWAELITQMIPSAEKVRFTVTGTEATHLALRISRAFTGCRKVVRFAGHFHGWHDHVSFPSGGAPGIVPGIAEDTLVCPPNDVGSVQSLLEDQSDIAAVILEPTGATFGHVPTPPEFLHSLRDLTARHGVILIFDEVICGFRCSPGGAQALYGVIPDLTTLAKIIAGGYPGAALVGRADILGALEFTNGSGGIRQPLVPHQGTYNAGPVSAAAGIATLKLVRDGDMIHRANQTAAAIRDGMNDALRRHGVNGCAYGLFSDFHLFLNDGPEAVTPGDIYAGKVSPAKLKGGMSPELSHGLRVGMLCHGIDIVGWPGGLVSGVHSTDDVDRTLTAFESVLSA